MLRPEWFAQAFSAFSDRLVHDSARRDRRAYHAHARFVGSRIVFAVLICALAPVALLVAGPPEAIALGCMIALAALMIPALVVSGSGRLARGQDLSTLLLAVAIVALALQTGGIWSHALLLFVVVLLDVALSGSKRSLWIGAGLVGLSVVLVALLPAAGQLRGLPFPLIGSVLVVYATVMAWIMVDRNERHLSAQMRSQARATVALDSVGDAVLWREANGDISFANAGARQLVGLDRRDLSERALLERINVGDRPAFLKALSDAASGSGKAGAELRISVEYQGERQVRTFEMEARRVDNGARGDASVIVLRDVTERHAADALRETARREAEKAASAKGQFLATMSHELRTPLNAIIGFSELLMQTDMIPAGDPRRDEYARIIHGSGQHLLEVVNAILDMSKIESGMMAVEQERVDLASVIRSSAEFVTVKAQLKDVTLVQCQAEDLPEIVSDRRALKQILLNLMSNAVKFSRAGGEVTVTCVRDRDHVEVAVNDTGIGISLDDLAQIGSPFFQARQTYDREHEGTGLGLSVVRGLVGLLGGAMSIESAPDQGTRVTVRLPIGGAEASASTEPVPITTRLRLRRAGLEPLFSSHPDAGSAGSDTRRSA